MLNMHLFQALKDIKLPSMYSEDIFKILLTDKTTEDILYFLNTKIKEELYEIFLNCIRENGRDKKKLKSFLKKLKKSAPKEMDNMDEDSSQTHTIESESIESDS